VAGHIVDPVSDVQVTGFTQRKQTCGLLVFAITAKRIPIRPTV
jgi:hypothetical protein